MELDCWVPEWNRNHVTEAEVCNALVVAHPDDPTKSAKAMWGNKLGCFKIQSTDFSPYMNTVLVIRGRELKLNTIKRRQGRFYSGAANSGFERQRKTFDPNSVKITIYDAYELCYRSISNEVFDNYFHDEGSRSSDRLDPKLTENNRMCSTTIDT